MPTTTTPRGSRLARIALAAAGLAVSPALLAAPAFAGSCPAGQSGHNVRAEDKTPASGVTDTVIGAIDLAHEPIHIKTRQLRLRRLVIQPGGVVPWHSHHDRPAIIYTLSGTVEEYASNCRVPIVHAAGDATPELHDTSHWWKNTGKTEAVLLSADLLPEKADPHTM